MNTTKIPARLTLSVVAACLVSFCGLLTETAVNVAFPTIMSDFQVTTKAVQWLTTGNLLVVAMITPLSAFLQKRFKLKSLFCFSTICFLAGTICAIFAPTFQILLLARLIQGVGTGVGVPIAFCIILEQIPFEKTGTYMGFGALVSAAAPALGPTYGGIITSVLGWRFIFVILIPVLIFTLVLGIVTIREIHEPQKAPIDMPGIALIMLTFFCLVFGFANIGSIATAPVTEIIFFAVGIAALILFVRHCMRSDHPLIQIDVFKNISFDCHLICFFLINAIMLGAAFLLPNYSQVVLTCTSMFAGLMLLPGAGLNAITGPFSGAVLDRIGAKLPIMTGTILMTAGIFLLMLFGHALTPAVIIGFYIIFGLGCGISFGNTMTVGMMRLPMEQKPYGNTAFNTLMQFAGAVGTSVSAACVAFSQNSAADISYEEKTAIGSTHGFIFLFALTLCCLLLQTAGFISYEKKGKAFSG
ncbi:MAG: DHA2 family efflux MFS transporter permease subunit [Clostridiales bacterium]|nr:DHA2 family efflux MFS transporter permease subunit [Clostridiales bacterium]